MTWLDCNQRSYIWIFRWTLREDVRLARAQTPELFFDLLVPFQLSAKEQKNNLCKCYLNTINDGDSQTSLLPIFPEKVGTSVHRLTWHLFTEKNRFPEDLTIYQLVRNQCQKHSVKKGTKKKKKKKEKKEFCAYPEN